MAPTQADKKEWFAEGLSFGCTQCGNCCSGPPGYVWFNQQEAQTMAAGLQLDVPTFLRRYAHTVNGRWTLNERTGPNGYDCVFLQRDDQGKALCSIYPVRPQQCRTWPFWPELLQSPAAWERASRKCPGMNKGTFYPVEKIRIIRDSNHSV
jgi:uncharacterized protein